MLLLRFAFGAIGLAATLASASPGEPRNGAEFVTLPARQDVKAAANKVEVIEFFMFHCPASRSADQSFDAAMKATMQVLDVLVAQSRAENAAAPT
jgi:thiol:disulfide interchange protein DsbA